MQTSSAASLPIESTARPYEMNVPWVESPFFESILKTKKLSPEQVKGAEVDERSDIFALGSTFFHVLSGRLPFHKSTPQAVLLQITNEDAPRLIRRREVRLRLEARPQAQSIGGGLKRVHVRAPAAYPGSAAGLRRWRLDLHPWLWIL